uniref:Heterogeneous nuclear ribonucleoprotein K n=1 Tax=Globodera pallida TaxID=36090 RepID=A0A183BHQ8_GLOPA
MNLSAFDAMKRQFNQDSNNGMQMYGGGGQMNGGSKRFRGPHDAGEAYQDALAAGKFELRLFIPSRSAGAVIGRGGEFIKSLRSKYDANINVPDRSTPERVLTIVCSVESVEDCFTEILGKLSEGEKASRGEIDIKVLVHQSHAGAIIGRSGSKIKEFREHTQCRFKVFQECCPVSSDRVCLITGDPSKLPGAVKMLVEFVKDIPFKGPHQPYDPHNYNPHMCHAYGGFEGPTMGGPPPPMLPPHFDYQPQHHGPPSAPQPGVGYAGFGPGGPPPHPGAPPPMGYTGPGGEQVTTTQVTIPSKLSGTIIGKRGECINRIRGESGARIEIDTQSDVFGTDERIITITGSPLQIQMAQFLLQQSVRQSESGRRYLSERQ